MTALQVALTQLLLCALLAVIGTNGKPPSAILDGNAAYDNEFPYHVALVSLNQYKCGGSIIDSRHILTAAHCIWNINYEIANMTVIAGTNYLDRGTGQEYRVKNVIVHPGFDKKKADLSGHDIAVITLRSAIKFDRSHRPVKLPTSDTPVGTKVTTCGWGRTSYPKGKIPSGLLKLLMSVIPNSKCVLPGYSGIRETHICAFARKGAGSCEGDSGGPLLDGDILVGIASFVFPCGAGYPDVFTRVHSYVDWINEVTKTY